MNIPSKKFEKKLFARGYRHVIGIDEVGMGCLAGPVVVCAVAVTAEFYKKNDTTLVGVRDSKLLSGSQREKFAQALMKTEGFSYQISLCYPKTIDRLNIYQASRHAMRRSIQKLLAHSFQLSGKKKLLLKANSYNLQAMVLVDGPHLIANLDVPQQAIIKGDQKVFAIACASVIAKVFRDRMMARYAKKHPGYGFEVHKGYGTPVHLARLRELGPCDIHRRSFAPVAKFPKGTL